MLSRIDSLDPVANVDDASSSGYNYNLPLILAMLALAISFIKYAESQNRLKYDRRIARIMSGFFRVIANTWHTTKDDIELINNEGKLLAMGPHRTGFVDADVVASKMIGTPPRFLATDGFHKIPLVKRIMDIAQAIEVPAVSKKEGNGPSSKEILYKAAGETLSKKGCVALFPQGNFSFLGQEPPRVYDGVADIALQNNAPIRVIRLDDFWSMNNPLLPRFIRNDRLYRALISLFHMNNVRVTVCCEIDFHLKPENAGLSYEQKKEEINALLYAYFRHTADLNPRQIDVIKKEISDKTHLTIWKNKLKRDTLEKEIGKLKMEGAELTKPTATAMKACSR